MTDFQEIKKKRRYSCGMNQSSVKKMCTFIFGEYFHSLKINPKTRDFEIYVLKTVSGKTFLDNFTPKYIEYFTEYWGETPGFKLKYYLGISVEDL